LVNPKDNEQEEKIEQTKYEDLVTEESEREVEDDTANEPRTVTEAGEDTPQKSDIQAILQGLTPKFKYPRINDIAQSAMVSRIFPDNLLDKQKLAVLALLEEYDEDDSEVPVIDIIMNMQDAMSIGYEGRGIADRMEMAGVAHEEEMKKLADGLGL
jgi:hypothetical protein